MALGIRGDLSYAFSWTLFFVRILRYDSLTLWPVDSCPRNQSEVEAATLRLNCSDVKESVNVYHCLPFSNLSGLVEFCLDGFSGLIEAGNCMVLSRDTLDDHPCDHFTNGCPNANYLSKNMYNYPACLKINPQNNCYIADPRCPNERFLKTTAMSTITSSEKETIKLTYTATDNKSLLVEATSIPALNGNDNPRLLYLIPVSLGVLLLLVAIALVILWNRRRSKRARKDKHQESEEGLHLMSDEDDPMNEMHTCLEDEEFLERYKIYLEEGSVEVCPISQIIIVGEHEVGKTTLLYRLQGKSRKEIEAIKSTRGIECHTEEHSFIITKNQLEMNLKGVNSFSVDPGHVSRFSKDNDRQRENEKEPNRDKQTEHDKELKHNTQTEDDTKPEHYKQTEDDREPTHDEQTEVNIESKHYKQIEHDKEPTHNTQTEDDTESKQAEYYKNSLIVMLEEEFEERNKRNLKLRFGNKDDVVLDVLDFAGQGEYYASHQTYIRKDAIFILAIDTSKDFNQRKKHKEREENKSIPEAVNKNLFLCDRPGVAFTCWSPKDYFYYWLKTIQIHGGSSERIIFIGTHEDEKRKDFNFVHLLNDAMAENLVTKAYSKPIIIDLCRYDEVTEEALTEIKNEICMLINKCRRENRPAKWVTFSSRFEIIKRKYPIIKIEDVLEMIDHFDFEMSDTEVADMLHFFHTSGKIIFFNMSRLQDILILDIQWFIDCFKHIIADRQHVEEDCRIVDVKDQKMLRNFHEKGVLEISLYKKLLTQKGISKQYQNTLGEYQSKLGMMFYVQNYEIDDGSSIDGWYVPSINTQEFKPSNARYRSNESSQILCFKFKDYLPYDFFGRLIVACVNSGHWHPYDFRLCKAGADMCYQKSGNEGEQIYLFTSKRIVTVQFIGKHSEQNGQEVKQEILTIVRQLVQFYSCSTEYELGFLCRKEEGYKENSVNHFVSKRYKFCQGCSQPCDWVDTESFWKEENKKKHTILTRREMDPFQIACKVYSHIVKRASAIAADTRTREGIYNKTDSAWLDDLVDIGRKLNDLQRKSKANDEKDQTALRNINRDLKMVSRNLDKCCKDLRKDIFFLWTQTEEFPEKNRGIPSVSLKNSSSGKISTKLTLEAKSDVAIRHHLWLRKLKGKYIVLYPSEEAEDKFEFQENENKLFLTIKNVDLQDEGSYFVVVETENGATVCREIVQLIADAQKATLDTDDEHDGKKTITETYINQIHIHHGENFVIGDSNTLNIKYDAKNKRKKKSKRQGKKEEYSEDDSSCSSDTPLVEPTNPVTNLERELSNLDVLARKSKYKLKVLDVRGDGHCLYHAFRQGVHTYRLPDHPTELRRQLVKYLEFNPITPNGIPYKDFLCFPLDPDHGILEPEDIAIETVEKEEDQKELRWQRFLKKIQDGEWGGSLEIMGLAQMCNVPVTVLSVGMNSFRLNEIQFNYTDETALKPTVFIGHLKLGGKGVHFVSFRSLHKNAIEQPTSMQHGEQRWKTIQDGKVIVDHQLDKRIGCIEITAKNRSNATGFRVGSKYVMTAFHVMEDLLVPFWKQVYNRLNNEERRPLRWTAENLPVDGSWNLSNLISSLDPRKQENMKKIAEEMVERSALIKFGFLDGKSFLENVFNFSYDIPFASQHHDIVILELSQENNLPPPLILKDTNIPGVKFHLVGNSEGIKLQHVPGCQIIEDQAELTDIVNRGIDFFTGLGYEREQVELDYATCVLSPDHILFHSPMNIVHGASSSPLIVIKEKPQVIGMLLRGYPKLYFNDSRCIGAHPELLIESGISMEKVHSLLKEHSLIQLAEDLFSQNK